MLEKKISLARKGFVWTLIFIVILITPEFEQDNVSAEPSFTIQQIEDPARDWVNMDTREYDSVRGERSTDILAVTYYADEDFLNATLWLYFPFKVRPNYSEVNYGMLIDADFDNRTGFDGIDYQFEIKWNNNSGAWNNILEAWSPSGDQRTIDSKINNTDFYEDGGNYVIISLNLDHIGSPSSYKVVFYAEAVKDGIKFADVARWVALPPPKLVISTSPTSIELRKGEEKTIEVKVNSTEGYEPTVNLSAISTVKNMNFEFPHNDTLRIPTYGLATTPLTITAPHDARAGPYTVFISAISSFPQEELLEVESANNENSTNSPNSDKEYERYTTSENILTQSSIIVTILEPLTLIDEVGNFWNKVGSPISFIYGILAGISPWIYARLRKRVNNHKQKNKDDEPNNRA
jgi:hypothetical protein